MLTVPCWLRHFWETDNLFSWKEKIKKKKNVDRPLVSIHLFISLSSLLLYPPCSASFVLAVHHFLVSNCILITFLHLCLPFFVFFLKLRGLLENFNLLPFLVFNPSLLSPAIPPFTCSCWPGRIQHKLSCGYIAVVIYICFSGPVSQLFLACQWWTHIFWCGQKRKDHSATTEDLPL